MAGALDGITIIELQAIGPVPFAGMMLADHGARVIRIERPDRRYEAYMKREILGRNREFLELDLKDPAGVTRLLELVGEADALIEAVGGLTRRAAGEADSLRTAALRLVERSPVERLADALARAF